MTSKGEMSRLGVLLYDFAAIAASPFLVFVFNENYKIDIVNIYNISSYIIVSTIIIFVLYLVSDAGRTSWEFVSLRDVERILIFISIGVAASIFLFFIIQRMDRIPRSVPALQFVFSNLFILLPRLVYLYIHKKKDMYAKSIDIVSSVDAVHCLVVGYGYVADMYIRYADKILKGRIIVEGILGCSNMDIGRSIRGVKVVGIIKDIERIINDYRLHGINIGAVVICVDENDCNHFLEDYVCGLESRCGVFVYNFYGSICESLTESYSNAIKNITPSVCFHNFFEIDVRYIPYLRVKRVIDILMSLTLIVILSPIIIISAIIVLVDVGLPVIFAQQRPGLKGRSFKLYKFRTMRPMAIKYGDRIKNNEQDRMRTSALGRLLRKTHLDELPQLFNILLGDMSFVGPRPLLLSYQPAEYFLRLTVRPGMTGWAQIHGGDHLTPEQKLWLDAWYIRNMSLLVDIKIIMRTLFNIAGGNDGDKIEKEIEEARRQFPENRKWIMHMAKKQQAEQMARDS